MPNRPRQPSGPKPERLKIVAEWKDAVKDAMAKGKPPVEPKKAPKKKRPRPSK